MSTPWIALAAALALAAIAGAVLRRRSGALVETPTSSMDTSTLGLSDTGPTILHFSAPWCGPCAAVRRVVDQVCAEFDGTVAHLEIDLDADPQAGSRFSVLSLPTTFIFDAAGRQRYRAAGVPTVADLRAAVRPLLA